MSNHPSHTYGFSTPATSTESESSSLTAFVQDLPSDPFSKSYEEQVNREMRNGIGSSSDTPEYQDYCQPLLPSNVEPGYAQESVLERGLQVPMRSRLITSGLSYPDVLAKCDVSEEQWSAFTLEITESAKMTQNQWTTTIGKGVGTLVVGGLLLGWLGAIPAVVVATKSRQRREEENLRTSNQLQQKVEGWNETYFRPRGILIRVDLPGDAEDMGAMDVSTSKFYQYEQQGRGTLGSKAERRAVDAEGKARQKAARKGRIVILPLDGNMSPVTTPSAGASIGGPREATSSPSISTLMYEQRTGLKDYYPDEPKP